MTGSTKIDESSQSKVVHMSTVDVNRIFEEISSINDKLTTLVRIEEKVLNLSGGQNDLKRRINEFEARERDKERDFQFTLQQAREFNRIKDNIVIGNKAANDNKENIQRIINWVGALASAIVIAAILNKEPPVMHRAEDSKQPRVLEKTENV